MKTTNKYVSLDVHKDTAVIAVAENWPHGRAMRENFRAFWFGVTKKTVEISVLDLVQ
jgi:hypothetical protein